MPPQKPASSDWFVQQAPPPQADWFALNAPPQEAARTTSGDLLDTGKGFAKGAGRTAIDILQMGMLGAIPQTRSALRGARESDLLAPTNLRQKQGMLGFDLASIATPVGWEAKGSTLIPRAMEIAETKILPGMTRAGARVALREGAGHVSERSAMKLADLPAQEGIGNARRVIGDAAAVKKPLSMAELASLGFSHYGAHSPELTAAIGALSLLRRPKVTTALTQGVYNAAPGINAVAGGSGALLAKALTAMFGGSQ